MNPLPTSTLPLAGITVLGLEHAVAAPFATRQLADLGARVIKIERPGAGDFARAYDRMVHGESSYFVWLNRSKESLTLDLKSEHGAEVLRRLVGRADVFLHNLGPGAADRLGLAPERLADLHPSLIQCRITGYGAEGAWSDRKAYDLLVQAETGLLSVTGSPDGIARAGISVADIAAGMYAFAGVLAALVRRGLTGVGGQVNVSLFDALAEWMGNPAYYTMYGTGVPERMGAHHATIAPYGSFRAADDRQIVLSVQNQSEWVRFCTDFLGRPELVADPRFVTNTERCEHRAEINEIVQQRVGAQSSAEVSEALERAGVAVSLVRTMSDFSDHPVLTSRDRWTEVESPGGRIRALIPPVDLDGVAPRMGPVPELGADTASILAEIGYGPSEIEQMYAAGAV